MTTSTVSRRSPASNPAPGLPLAPRPLPWVVWCLLAIGWLLALRSPPASHQVQLWAGGEPAALTPDDAWSLPVVRGLPGSTAAVWSYWLFAVAAGGVIAVAAQRAEKHLGLAIAMLAGCGLALLLSPRDLLPAAAIVAAGWAASIQRTGLRRVLRLLLAGAALAVSLDFGLVWLAIGCGAVLNRSANRAATPQRGLLLVLIIGTALLAALAFWQPGFLPVLARPVSWIWFRPDTELLPSCAPVLSQAEDRIPQALLLLAMAGIWWRTAVRRTGGMAVIGPLFTFSLIGLGCARYLPLCLLSLLTVWPVGFVSEDGPSWRPAVRKLGVLLSLAAIVAGLGVHRRTFTAWVAEGQLPARRVDPSTWGIAGSVQLMNLDECEDWPPNGRRTPLTLLVNDRWELFGGLYPRYAGICRDLREGRNESYLLTDGTWGGYLPALEEWTPTLLVADSRDLDGIRNLSISPDWRIMGLDESRAIFGRTDDPRCQAQGQRALRVLFQLEWPMRPAVDPQILVVPDSAAARRVAGVLCAIRLPYAALRLLPPVGDRQTEVQRTWCYLELAHRAWRYTGEASLLDQYRALSRLRRQLEAGDWTTRDRERITQGLRGLGLDDIADSFPADAVEGGVEPQSVEEQIRAALRRGADAECRRVLPQLPSAEARYYGLLADAPERTAAELYQELNSQFRGADFPDRLRAEAAYYLGCLAIEAGDGRSASGWLQECLRDNPQSAWAVLAQFYLGQLGTP